MGKSREPYGDWSPRVGEGTDERGRQVVAAEQFQRADIVRRDEITGQLPRVQGLVQCNQPRVRPGRPRDKDPDEDLH